MGYLVFCLAGIFLFIGYGLSFSSILLWLLLGIAGAAAAGVLLDRRIFPENRKDPVWTHTGLLYGILPVFLEMSYPARPIIGARHPAFEILIDVAEDIVSFILMVRAYFDPSFIPEETKFGILITGELQSTHNEENTPHDAGAEKEKAENADS